MNRLEGIQASTKKLISECLEIRRKVFIEEQGVPEEEELDDLDSSFFNVIGFLDLKPVATGRLMYITEKKMKIGRMAVLRNYRKLGYGTIILRFLETAALNLGAEIVSLNSQEYIKNFYINSGYQTKGEIFIEAKIPHIEMFKKIKN